MNSPPKIYIGSSAEGQEVAKNLQVLLREYEVALSTESILAPSKTAVESLESALPTFDFAIVVLTSKDVEGEEKTSGKSLLPDIALQLGLLMGAIKRNRTFILCEERVSLENLSILEGVRVLTYRIHTSGDLISSLGPAATQIANQIKVISQTNSQSGQTLLNEIPSDLPERTVRESKPVVTNVPVYENLPAASYSKFINRPEQFNKIIEALSQRVSVVSVVGFGGLGKTSLVREVAYYCLRGESGWPQFEAVVWVCDKSRAGDVTLNHVLDTIAETLDYPGYRKLIASDKRREIDRLLRKIRVLLVVDNFETITDSDLINWWEDFPEHSKAILITREEVRGLTSGCIQVDVPEMSEPEITAFIQHHVRQLAIEDLIGNIKHLDPLLEATGGNPKAIEVALGYLKQRRRPLQEIIADLQAAKGKLFDDLFSRCWGLLDPSAQNVLLAMSLFPYGTTDTALEVVSDVKCKNFRAATERLIDSRLLDAAQKSLASPPIYYLHPLVNAFVKSKFLGEPSVATPLRRRWVRYWVDLAASIDFCWNDICRLELLDVEGARETVRMAIEWAFNNREYREAISVAKGVRYYFYVRGFWSVEPSIHIIRANAAKAISDSQEEFEALTYHINIAAKQSNIEEVEKYLPRLEVIQNAASLTKESLIDYQHAKALYFLAKRQLTDAEDLWKKNIDQLTPSNFHAYSANTRWLAVCLYRQGRLDEAKDLFHRALAHAQEHNFTRARVAIELQLIAILLDQGEGGQAAMALDGVEGLVSTVKDRLYIAEMEYQLYRLNKLRGDTTAAKEHLQVASDLYERLGLRERHRKATGDFSLLVAPV